MAATVNKHETQLKAMDKEVKGHGTRLGKVEKICDDNTSALDDIKKRLDAMDGPAVESAPIVTVNPTTAARMVLQTPTVTQTVGPAGAHITHTVYHTPYSPSCMV